jgi:large subunit ribosomal protein L25
MLKLKAKTRDKTKNTNILRSEGILPAVIYGYETEDIAIQMDNSEFDKIYRKAGESTLINLDIEDEDGKKMKHTVLIQDTQEHAITNDFTHVDFYQPNLKEEVEVEIPLEFIGQSKAVKEEDGTLVKNLSEVTIKALPDKLIHEIKVDISVLENFDSVVKVEDLKIPEGVEIMEEKEEVVALVSRPQDIDEELEEPIEEGVEDVEVVGEDKELEESKLEEEGEGDKKKNKEDSKDSEEK